MWAYLYQRHATRCRAMRCSPSFAAPSSGSIPASFVTRSQEYRSQSISFALTFFRPNCWRMTSSTADARAAGWVQVTDFDLHRMWVQPGMRGYFAASDEIAFRMVAARHCPTQSVARHRNSRSCRRFPRNWIAPNAPANSSVEPDKTTLLLMTGGAGIAGSEKFDRATSRRFPAISRSLRSPAEMKRCWRIIARLAAAHPRPAFSFGLYDVRSNGLWLAPILRSPSPAA